MAILDIIPGNSKWLFLVAVAAFYGVGWVAWRVQNDCIARGYGPLATSFWSTGTLFLFFPVFPLYLLLRPRMGIKPGASGIAQEPEATAAPTVMCPKCGRDTPGYLTTCEHCGAHLVPPSLRQGLGTVSCGTCGASNPVGAEACVACGLPLV